MIINRRCWVGASFRISSKLGYKSGSPPPTILIVARLTPSQESEQVFAAHVRCVMDAPVGIAGVRLPAHDTAQVALVEVNAQGYIFYGKR